MDDIVLKNGNVEVSQENYIKYKSAIKSGKEDIEKLQILSKEQDTIILNLEKTVDRHKSKIEINNQVIKKYKEIEEQSSRLDKYNYKMVNKKIDEIEKAEAKNHSKFDEIKKDFALPAFFWILIQVITGIL